MRDAGRRALCMTAIPCPSPVWGIGKAKQKGAFDWYCRAWLAEAAARHATIPRRPNRRDNATCGRSDHDFPASTSAIAAIGNHWKSYKGSHQRWSAVGFARSAKRRRRTAGRAVGAKPHVVQLDQVLHLPARAMRLS
jgi:hypothetical protein